jgi:hypothetical protein
LAAMAFPASCSRDRILGSALEAYLEEQPALLCNLFLCRICDWHFYYFKFNGRLFSTFLFLLSCRIEQDNHLLLLLLSYNCIADATNIIDCMIGALPCKTPNSIKPLSLQY